MREEQKKRQRLPQKARPMETFNRKRTNQEKKVKETAVKC